MQYYVTLVSAGPVAQLHGGDPIAAIADDSEAPTDPAHYQVILVHYCI